jgi:hypothetical protein
VWNLYVCFNILGVHFSRLLNVKFWGKSLFFSCILATNYPVFLNYWCIKNLWPVTYLNNWERMLWGDTSFYVPSYTHVNKNMFLSNRFWQVCGPLGQRSCGMLIMQVSKTMFQVTELIGCILYSQHPVTPTEGISTLT